MTFRLYYLTGAAVIVLQALILLAMGQPLICACGVIKLFGGVVSSPEMSQQLTDWYSYSHIIHGIGFYLLLWLIAPAAPVGLRFMLAIGLEAGWEVLENTPFVINRYREFRAISATACSTPFPTRSRPRLVFSWRACSRSGR
jgi:hypothetical protein